MKRTRRIEITSYRSHVTLSGRDAEPDGTGTPAMDILLEALGASPLSPKEVFEDRSVEVDASHRVASPPPRRSGLLRLPGWLRRG